MDSEAEEEGLPHISALYTFCSFVFFGLIPLVIDISLLSFHDRVPENVSFWTATILTMITLFVLGSIKAKLTKKNILYSGFQMVLIGGAAALVAYIIAYFLAALDDQAKDLGEGGLEVVL